MNKADKELQQSIDEQTGTSTYLTIKDNDGFELMFNPADIVSFQKGNDTYSFDLISGRYLEVSKNTYNKLVKSKGWDKSIKA